MTFNFTPRKCLGCRASVEAILAELASQIGFRFNGPVALRGIISRAF